MGRTRGVLGRLGLVNVHRLTRALSVDLPTLMAGVEAKRSREVPGRPHARPTRPTAADKPSAPGDQIWVTPSVSATAS